MRASKARLTRIPYSNTPVKPVGFAY
jgi:hypothetical protein